MKWEIVFNLKDCLRSLRSETFIFIAMAYSHSENIQSKHMIMGALFSAPISLDLWKESELSISIAKLEYLHYTGEVAMSEAFEAEH
jgi:hypothetical protein